MCFATCSSCVTLFVLSLSSPTRCDVSGDVTGRRLSGPLRLFGLALGSGAAGVGLSYWRRPSEEIELPAVPEPEAFIHPYETWQNGIEERHGLSMCFNKIVFGS